MRSRHVRQRPQRKDKQSKIKNKDGEKTRSRNSNKGTSSIVHSKFKLPFNLSIGGCLLAIAIMFGFITMRLRFLQNRKSSEDKNLETIFTSNTEQTIDHEWEDGRNTEENHRHHSTEIGNSGELLQYIVLDRIPHDPLAFT